MGPSRPPLGEGRGSEGFVFRPAGSLTDPSVGGSFFCSDFRALAVPVARFFSFFPQGRGFPPADGMSPSRLWLHRSIFSPSFHSFVPVAFPPSGCNARRWVPLDSAPPVPIVHSPQVTPLLNFPFPVPSYGCSPRPVGISAPSHVPSHSSRLFISRGQGVCVNVLLLLPPLDSVFGPSLYDSKLIVSSWLPVPHGP